MPVPKKKTKRLKSFTFLYLYWSFSSDVMAVKGLNKHLVLFVPTCKKVRVNTIGNMLTQAMHLKMNVFQIQPMALYESVQQSSARMACQRLPERTCNDWRKRKGVLWILRHMPATINEKGKRRQWILLYIPAHLSGKEKGVSVWHIPGTFKRKGKGMSVNSLTHTRNI